MTIEKDLEALREFALERGAASAEIIPAHEVVFDERTIHKCQYGCPSYGRYLTCPPFAPLPSEFEKALRTYKWAVVLECDLADLNRLVVEVEKAAMRR